MPSTMGRPCHKLGSLTPWEYSLEQLKRYMLHCFAFVEYITSPSHLIGYTLPQLDISTEPLPSTEAIVMVELGYVAI